MTQTGVVRDLARALLLAVATVLLLSFGGAIVAAPLTVPLLLIARYRSDSGGYRVAAAAVIALTIAEVAWGVAYVGFGEEQPWIWLVPLVSAATVLAALSSKRCPFYRHT